LNATACVTPISTVTGYNLSDQLAKLIVQNQAGGSWGVINDLERMDHLIAQR
jgi:hypothetical protein